MNQITISFEDRIERRNGREWNMIPKDIAKYIIKNEASVRNSIYKQTVEKRDESVWWQVIDINYDEELWMNNYDGEMIIINNETNEALYTSF